MRFCVFLRGSQINANTKERFNKLFEKTHNLTKLHIISNFCLLHKTEYEKKNDFYLIIDKEKIQQTF